MKKLLNLLCTISLIVTGASGIVANSSYKNVQENEKTHIHFTDAHWARQQEDGFNFLPTIMLGFQKEYSKQIETDIWSEFKYLNIYEGDYFKNNLHLVESNVNQFVSQKWRSSFIKSSNKFRWKNYYNVWKSS
ncbi:hypothetical protein [Spiroplasma endosymbiont of Stenodema calcarata]|uniref:hypothetical protein n=1 Tax=Spiroplasma endosymbiont of Stenodema calcarata TaxID=3139328 RepID=UPI003CCA8A97